MLQVMSSLNMYDGGDMTPEAVGEEQMRNA